MPTLALVHDTAAMSLLHWWTRVCPQMLFVDENEARGGRAIDVSSESDSDNEFLNRLLLIRNSSQKKNME